MIRRNFLRKILLFLLAFIFGYTVKKEGEKMVLQRVDPTMVDGKAIADEINVLKEQFVGKATETALYFIQNPDILKDNTIIVTTGFYSPGDGGSAIYKVQKIQSNESWVSSGYGFDINDNGEIKVQEKKLKYIPQNATNVKCLGAKGNNKGNDTVCLQQSFEFFMNDSIPSVYIPTGKYHVYEPLECYKEGRYFKVYGDSKRESMLVAKANMKHVIRLSTPDIYTSCAVFDIGVQMGNFADIGIDSKFSTYSTFERISVWTSKPNSINIKLGSWCNKLLDSKIYGNYDYKGNSFGIIPAIGLAVENNLSTNNLIVERNVFQSLDTAIRLFDNVNDVHFHKNTFDNIGKILVALNGIRHSTFRYNYCESSGGSNKNKYDLMPVLYKDGTYKRNLSSAFILHENISMKTEYPISIDISNNQFANCRKQELISASGIKLLRFKHNSFYGLSGEGGSYEYNKVIKVFGKGVTKTVNGILDIENRYSEIKDIVVYDNNYSAYYNDGNIILKESHVTNMIKYTVKSKTKPKLNSDNITDEQDVIVNKKNTLRVDYQLSDYDSKHPHKVIIDIEKIAGTKLTYSYYEGPSTNIYYNADIATESGSNFSTTLSSNNEVKEKQKKEFYLLFNSDGDVKIKGIFLSVANADNSIIQLV